MSPDGIGQHHRGTGPSEPHDPATAPDLCPCNDDKYKRFIFWLRGEAGDREPVR